MPGVDGGSPGRDRKGPPDATQPEAKPAAAAMVIEYDDFGLPIKKYIPLAEPRTPDADAEASPGKGGKHRHQESKGSTGNKGNKAARATPNTSSDRCSPDAAAAAAAAAAQPDSEISVPQISAAVSSETKTEGEPSNIESEKAKAQTKPSPEASTVTEASSNIEDQAVSEARKPQHPAAGHKRDASTASGHGVAGVAGVSGVSGVSAYSHQQLTSQLPEKEEEKADEWQTMPAYAAYDMYDDDNKLIAKEYTEADDETYGYGGLGGAGKGYTKVLVDDDAESATSMDENTQYLFKEAGGSTSIADDDGDQRDAVSQLQATKDLLTEGQRVAYVGLTRLELSVMLREVESLEPTSSRTTRKQLTLAAENMKMWSQKMMIRLYAHMDISPAEQVMIEQLSAHGVIPQDLTPVLMANARVKNPMAADEDGKSSIASPTPSRPASVVSPATEQAAEPPPPYSVDDGADLTNPVLTPVEMPTTQKIDIDIRWTVLCDLFLVLIADSIYDARSRSLLEKVASDLEISWLEICRFEKKVTDALEMQQNAETENWNEEGHMETRRKLALKRRYMMMGLATVGGGLVIGLSAGLLAPAIGMGLAAGLATIVGSGSTAAGGFLGGAGGAAIITSTAAASGSLIGGRAANRRTGSVKTFEYRPLNNNKRVNLIVTVSGWMTGKVDDVRLPFSTVDPVMGDIYSVLWEPEMLTSMGDTINILATEALTQGLQQVLGNTILVGLMAAITVPVVLTKLSYLIDNPWTVSLDRATMAGLILADSLIARNLGTRPITLVGYSLGSRVIFSCLQELAKKGAFGLVQNVYLFGSPMVVKRDEYLRARTVVSGRFLNGYNRNDWILGYLFRLTNGGIRRIAGLGPIENIPGVENMDVSAFAVGHMDYRTAMPRLLRECGWLVENDEFTEIEDPDPENHGERQRELINEIEEARREFEKEEKESKGGGGGGGGGGAFGFFKKKKVMKRQEWELYEEVGKAGVAKSGKTEDKEGNNHGVLFDVDAIRAEIAKETQNKDSNPGAAAAAAAVDDELLQVREIKSTLPPIKLELRSSTSSPGAPPQARTPRHSLRDTRSTAAPSSPPARPPDSSSDRPPPPPPPPPPAYETHSPSPGHTPPYPTSHRRAQTSPYHAYGHHHHHHHSSDDDDDDGGGGGGIRMTFDDAGRDDHRQQAKPPLFASDRPEMRWASTVPNITLADPWADEGEGEGEGKEKEISLTFA
ncbi:DUF726-domain-containing protein [Trichocladium antarcticum]|uniref:DUF726-domain-containing protein n=1 Tax=Trichocladium antarcticum TaxID=1450529 RepID=A0AAN6UF90_9PEZI|nr:DUF726-domain-containing protein [Trichocladium antarcticum]